MLQSGTAEICFYPENEHIDIVLADRRRLNALTASFTCIVSHQRFFSSTAVGVCSARAPAAGVEIETTVHRVFEDGSFETLAFPSRLRRQFARKPRSGATGHCFCLGIPGRYCRHLTPSTELEQKLGAREPGSGVSMLAGESANAAFALPAADEVAEGDVLRFELTIHNANSYAVPPFALEVIEHLPPGTTLIGVSTGAAEWALQLPTPGDEQAAGLAPTQRTLRLQNTRALTAGQRSLFSYDVTVKSRMRATCPMQKRKKKAKFYLSWKAPASIATAGRCVRSCSNL